MGAREDFIKKYTPDVIAASQKALALGYKIFPSVVMAQALIESADSHGVPGQGATAVRANNFFGIKADSSWHGQTMSFQTPNDGKPVSLFRVYANPGDSIQDHDIFLEQNGRYRSNGVFTAKTPEEQAADLAKAGYAEAPNYDKAIISMINAYNLKSLDDQFFNVDVKKKILIGTLISAFIVVFLYVKKEKNPVHYFIGVGAGFGLSLLGCYIYSLYLKSKFK